MEQPLPVSAWIELPASWGDPARRYIFSEPVDVWQADSLPAVRPALERVAHAQREGQFVVGFVSYEAAPAFDPAMRTPPKGDLPYAWFASYRSHFSVSAFQRFSVSSSRTSHPSSLTSKDEYLSAVNTALAHIRVGNIYQVNYTVRAELAVADPFALFQTLLAAAPMPHAAYLKIFPRDAGERKGGSEIVSLSPELFIRKRGNTLESRPMKGTAPRRPSWVEDEAARIALSKDEKNRAENVMIVDLVRNDLGRVCEMGSVTVPELWRVDRFPTVHQMTSLVRGELRDDASLFDVFAALFPPGSVTGAPKIRAMDVIAELEPQPRGIYCGTIGLFFPNGDFECNVAIRTIEVHRSSFIAHRSILGLGSGVVADSDPETEWHETLLKGKFVSQQPLDFSIYETIRYNYVAGFGPPARGGTTGGSFLDLHSHLRRLRQSCIYFGRPFPLHEIIERLRSLLASLGNEPARVRLDLHSPSSVILHPSSLVETQVIRENLSWPAAGLTVMLSDVRLDPEDFRLYHKTTLRPEKYVELEKARALGATEVLFLNTRGELCEGALSNIILKLDGEWLTPALHCGLLPGTWREKKLTPPFTEGQGEVKEAILTLGDLERADEIRMGNAVRGEGKVIGVLGREGKPLFGTA